MLKKRSDGRFRCYYKGKQFYGKTAAEAYAARDAYIETVKNGIVTPNITVSEYCAHYLPLAKPDVSARTYNGYVRFLEILMDEIGNYQMAQVRPSNIKAIYSNRFVGLSDKYIQHAKGLYTGMFDAAVDDGIIARNPCRADAAKPHKGTFNGHRAITPDERNIVTTLGTNHRVYPIVMLMLYAGLRPAEALAMRMENVDLEKGEIHVTEFMHYAGWNKTQVTSSGKTGKSTRVVPIFSPLRKALESLPKGTDLIIHGKDGKPLSHSGWSAAWRSYVYALETEMNGIAPRWYGITKAQKALKEKGLLPPFKTFEVLPYDLRHSFVTWCRDNGVEIHTVIEWCGHVDSTMILKVYDSVTASRSRREAEKLQDLINSGEA